METLFPHTSGSGPGRGGVGAAHFSPPGPCPAPSTRPRLRDRRAQEADDAAGVCERKRVNGRKRLIVTDTLRLLATVGRLLTHLNDHHTEHSKQENG